MVNTENLSPEMVETISTIRALIQSRKEMTTERDLMREYRELNGENIQYKKFGFRSLENFLVSTREFILRSGQSGDLLISAIPTKESMHIVDMVQKQKTDRKKKRKTMTMVIK